MFTGKRTSSASDCQMNNLSVSKKSRIGDNDEETKTANHEVNQNDETETKFDAYEVNDRKQSEPLNVYLMKTGSEKEFVKIEFYIDSNLYCLGFRFRSNRIQGEQSLFTQDIRRQEYHYYQQLWNICRDHFQTTIPTEVCQMLSMDVIINMCCFSNRRDLLDYILGQNKLVQLSKDKRLFCCSVAHLLQFPNIIEWSLQSLQHPLPIEDLLFVTVKVIQLSVQCRLFPFPSHVTDLLRSSLRKADQFFSNEQDRFMFHGFLLSVIHEIISCCFVIYCAPQNFFYARQLVPYFSWAVQMIGCSFPTFLSFFRLHFGNNFIFHDEGDEGAKSFISYMQSVTHMLNPTFQNIFNLIHPHPLGLIDFFKWEHLNILQHNATHHSNDWFLCKNPDVHFVFTVLLSGRNVSLPYRQQTAPRYFEYGLIEHILDFIRPTSVQPSTIDLHDDNAFFRALHEKPPQFWHDHSISPGLLLENEIKRFQVWSEKHHW